MVRKILYVDDEEKLQKLVGDYLNDEGFQVSLAADGAEALEKFSKEKPDLVVLDWLLPKKSGLDICRDLRKNYTTPIIMLTAKSDEVDKILGLELGADDYLTKPFSLRELAARIKAVLRRTSQSNRTDNGTILRYADLEIDLERRIVKVRDSNVKLTPTEFKILAALIQKPGRVFSRLQLLELLDLHYDGYERSLDTHISNLRRKLEENAAGFNYIQTVYGTGYKLK